MSTYQMNEHPKFDFKSTSNIREQRIALGSNK